MPGARAEPRAAVVRRAGPDDVAGIVALWIELIDYHRSLDPDYPPLPGIRETLRTETLRGVDSEHCEVFVADSGSDGLVGFLFAELEPRPGAVPAPVPLTGQIHELWVDPAARGAGTGRALVAEADAFFDRHGRARASVRVEGPNRAGLEFWRRLGFRERARIMEKIS